MEIDQRNALIEGIKVEYSDRAITVLNEIKAVCERAGMPCDEPGPMHDDTYRWAMSVWRTEADKQEGYEKCIDVWLEIAEAHEYGDEPDDGVNFGISITEWGGRILGDLTPHNYTDECWVAASDADAVEERWLEIENAGFDNVPFLIGME